MSKLEPKTQDDQTLIDIVEGQKARILSLNKRSFFLLGVTSIYSLSLAVSATLEKEMPPPRS